MGCCNNFTLCYKVSYIFNFFLVFLVLSSTQLRLKAEGRTNLKSLTFSQTVNEEKVMMRAQIGSRPPRCEKMCNSCGHCEAIQVPTNPQTKNGNHNNNNKDNVSALVSSIAYARRDDNSNYKPMSWKCKCGKYLFNP